MMRRRKQRRTGEWMRAQGLLIGLVLHLLLTSCGQQAPSPTAATGPDQAAMIRERAVQADGVTLHIRIAGDAQAGKVLVALHGGPGNASDYMLSLEQLAGEAFAVVTYDQRGTGQSNEPSNGYSMVNYVADVEAVRQAVGAEQIYLFGHSWGGVVALRYAAAHPQRVNSIILMGSGVLTPEVAQAAQHNKAQRVAALQEEGIIPQSINSVADILPAYFSEPSFMPAELRDMFYSPAVEQRTWAALADYDFAAGLDALDQPVLLLWGEDDPFGVAMAEGTKHSLSEAEVELVVLKGCGHYWHECPAEFFSQVRAFLGASQEP